MVLALLVAFRTWGYWFMNLIDVLKLGIKDTNMLVLGIYIDKLAAEICASNT